MTLKVGQVVRSGSVGQYFVKKAQEIYVTPQISHVLYSGHVIKIRSNGKK
jgi:hypothetical protein